MGEMYDLISQTFLLAFVQFCHSNLRNRSKSTYIKWGGIAQTMMDMDCNSQRRKETPPRKRGYTSYQRQMRIVASSKVVVLGKFSISQRKLYVINFNVINSNDLSAKYPL